MIKAHKVVLSSSSEFFKNILTMNRHETPLIYLKDIKHDILNYLLKFIYIGQCELTQDNLDLFLSTGKDLKIEDLLDIPINKKKEYTQIIPPEDVKLENDIDNTTSMSDEEKTYFIESTSDVKDG